MSHQHFRFLRQSGCSLDDMLYLETIKELEEFIGYLEKREQSEEIVNLKTRFQAFATLIRLCIELTPPLYQQFKHSIIDDIECDLYYGNKPGDERSRWKTIQEQAKSISALPPHLETEVRGLLGAGLSISAADIQDILKKEEAKILQLRELLTRLNSQEPLA